MFNVTQTSGPASVFYPTVGSSLNGSSVYLTKASEFSGTPDLSRGVISFWFEKVKVGTSDFILDNISSVTAGSNSLRLFIQTVIANQGQVQLGLFKPSSSFSFRILGNSNLLDTSTAWNHCLISWDTNFSSGSKLGSIYINDSNQLSSLTDTNPAFVPDSSASWGVGVDVRTNTQLYEGGLSEFYANFGTFLDISILANRRRFITATKRPVFLGVDGSLPTNSQPSVYLKGSGTGFNVNSGSGGDFTTTGTLTTPTTTPSSP